MGAPARGRAPKCRRSCASTPDDTRDPVTTPPPGMHAGGGTTSESRVRMLRPIVTCTTLAQQPQWRSLSDPIVVSTLPHLLASAAVVGSVLSPTCHSCPWLMVGYAATAAVSSVLSIVWHMSHERRSIVSWLDYAFAALWTAYDIVAAASVCTPTAVVLVAGLDAATFTANQATDWLAGRSIVPYETAHSYWHVLSCIKSVAVACLLGHMHWA